VFVTATWASDVQGVVDRAYESSSEFERQLQSLWDGVKRDVGTRHDRDASQQRLVELGADSLASVRFVCASNLLLAFNNDS
jgi:hypothetical protein